MVRVSLSSRPVLLTLLGCAAAGVMAAHVMREEQRDTLERRVSVYRDIERERARAKALGLPPPQDPFVEEYDLRKASGTLVAQQFAANPPKRRSE